MNHVAPQRQAVLLGSERHEIETILRGGGLDSEPDIGLTGGDVAATARCVNSSWS